MSRAITRRSRSESGTSPETMRWARPSTMAVLPTPGSPMSTGLFLVRRREHLDHAPDLVVAADHRVELALLGGLGQVAAELLQRLVLVLGVLVGHAVRPAHLLHGIRELVAGRAGVDIRIGGQGKQQMFGGDVLVAHPARFVVGALEQFDQPAAQRGRRRRLARDRGEGVEGLVGPPANALGVGPGTAKHRYDDAALLLEQRDEQVRGRDLRIATSTRQPLSGGEGLLRLDCESISLHRKSKSKTIRS